MAFYKANVFHWHLTDDQAWRLEIPQRPKLVKANRWQPEFYSTADVVAIVEYAASLFINVLPTIETPGHSLAALAAYPELACRPGPFEVPKTRVGTYTDIMCVSKKDVEDFAADVFAEVARLFPYGYVHVGGDEAPTITWESSEHVKAFAGKAGLNNLGADVMEAWFCRLSQLLAKHNRTLVMWDDHFVNRFGVTRLCPDAEKTWVVQAWKLDPPLGLPGQDSISPAFPFRTIASPMKSVYLDYPVAVIDYNKTLAWTPGAKHGNTLGGCANMWTEDSEPKDVGGKVYPRYLGITERLWGGVLASRALHREGGRPGDSRPGSLDLPERAAALQHCTADGPLLAKFGFKCGKFERVRNGRSPTWARAYVDTSMDSYSPEFSPAQALDDDDESYFWAIAPKRGDSFEVGWRQSAKSQTGDVLGKWFKRLVASSGAVDRPGDQLEEGELWVKQWLPSAQDSGYEAKWSKVAQFQDGSAIAQGEALEQGPVVGVRILCTASQTKWFALREITATPGTARPHPAVDELPEPHHAHGRSPHGSKYWNEGW
uniref:beta-N-acetylhexosaminidase n=1 Tax=Zooxanthella nutricula TaxID=1333877 RepID=A0A7S2Q3M3_9DINO